MSWVTHLRRLPAPHPRRGSSRRWRTANRCRGGMGTTRRLFAKHSPVPLRVEPIADTARFAPLRFQFDISMGVRKDDRGLRSTLDVIIAQHQPEIDALLRSYGVPLESTGLGGIQPASTSATER